MSIRSGSVFRQSKKTFKPDIPVLVCRSTTHSRSPSPRRSLCISIRIPTPGLPPTPLEPLKKPLLKRISANIRYKSEPRNRRGNTSLSSFKAPLQPQVIVISPTDEDITRDLVNTMKDHYRVLQKYPKTTSQHYKPVEVMQSCKGCTRSTVAIQRLTGLKVIIKSFPRLGSKLSRAKLLKEITLMTKCRHPSIQRLLEIYESAEYVNLVLEHCTGTIQLGMKENQAKKVFVQIVKGVRACHRQGVVLRDLQLMTVLGNETGNEVKIGDFSAARQMSPGEKLSDQTGQLAFSAPETLINQPYDGFSSDIWSLGVILYALLAGKLPFQASNSSDLAKLILKGAYPPINSISRGAKWVLAGMLEMIPGRRLSIEEVLEWVGSEGETGREEEVDERALGTMETAGFSKRHILECLESGELTHLTAAYELLRLNQTYHLACS